MVVDRVPSYTRGPVGKITKALLYFSQAEVWYSKLA